MKNLKIKRIVAGGLISCLVCSGAAMAKEPTTDLNDADLVPVAASTDETQTPYTMYYYASSINMYRMSGYANIHIATQAVADINHIYHDVTIYKNYKWYSSTRYNDWNCQRLDTFINVPASSGDYIEVYVDNYTEHNGCVESRSTSRTLTF